jgi:hypothetical protein
MAKKSGKSAGAWAQLHGIWRFANTEADYTGPSDRLAPVGLCLSSIPLRSGSVSVQVKLLDTSSSAGRIIVGYNGSTGNYYSVGLGGHNSAYALVSFTHGGGWQPIAALGAQSQLMANHTYAIEVRLLGQRISLAVDGVRIFQTALPSPLQGDQIGLFAWGNHPVEFKNFQASANQPNIFVVMQFGEPYDSLYREVIKPVCTKLGFNAFRGDDVFKPGVILEDIRRGILDSDIIIAEITPVNANVFYELGYAHALEKPTILLANRNTEKLPFDISSYRVIFYDDTIGGKSNVELTLTKHLTNIKNGQ